MSFDIDACRHEIKDHSTVWPVGFMEDACDEIEQLREENAKLKRLNPSLSGYANGYADALDDGAQAPMSEEMISAGMGLARNEIERLRKVIERLGSNEAFDLATAHIPKELDMRMVYAREALSVSTTGKDE